MPVSVQVSVSAAVCRRSVQHASGLSTSVIKRLLDNAHALLTPSFAEGYGYPVAQALVAGNSRARRQPILRRSKHSCFSYDEEQCDPRTALIGLVPFERDERDLL
jgi:hypothetical protein